MRSSIYVDGVHVKDVEGTYARSMSKAMEDPDIVKILNGRKVCRLDLLTSGDQRTYRFHSDLK
jgi:hypothetical protein